MYRGKKKLIMYNDLLKILVCTRTPSEHLGDFDNLEFGFSTTHSLKRQF
jgi:hypothetical protein